jgi:hypothetical protein
MPGFSGIDSAFATLSADIGGCVLGFTLAAIFVLVVRNTRAAWTWVVVMAIAGLVLVPSMHLSQTASVTGVIGTAVAVGFLVLKDMGATSDFGIRAALAIWWVRIGVSALALYVLVYMSSVLLFIAILVGVAVMWWHYQFEEFAEYREKLAERFKNLGAEPKQGSVTSGESPEAP